MNIVCLDLEGVLVPGIWIALTEASDIPEFRRITRDEPDYNKLTRYHIGILEEHDFELKEIQGTIATINPMSSAGGPLDELRSFTQVMTLSGTSTQFASPLVKRLDYPAILYNSLEVAESGGATGFKMRIEHSKLTTARTPQLIGYEAIAGGDSYNDLGMIEVSKASFLFRMTEEIKKTYSQYPVFETCAELLAVVKAAQ